MWEESQPLSVAWSLGRKATLAAPLQPSRVHLSADAPPAARFVGGPLEFDIIMKELNIRVMMRMKSKDDAFDGEDDCDELSGKGNIGDNGFEGEGRGMQEVCECITCVTLSSTPASTLESSGH